MHSALPIISYVELTPCCIQPSKTQAYILPRSSQISTRKAKGLGLKMTRKRSFDGRDDGMCLERDDIQLLLLDLERSGENFTGRAWIASIPAFPSPLL